MKDWLSLLPNPTFMKMLFDEPPSLQGFNLLEVRLDRGGPTISLRGDIREFADHPPRKWNADANSVQVTLEVYGLQYVRVEGWKTQNFVDIEIEELSKNPPLVRLVAHNDEIHVEAKGLGLDVSDITAYTIDLAAEYGRE